MLISVEGIDGSGKTTIIQIVLEMLKKAKYNAIMTIEVDENQKTGKLLREALQDETTSAQYDALLFALNRVFNCDKIIKPLLDAGHIVLTDRYLTSSLVYQPLRGLEYNWIEIINKYAIKPDLVIILDLDPAQALSRISKERKYKEKYEKLEFLIKLRDKYLEFLNKKIGKTKYVKIDAGNKLHQVSFDVFNEIIHFITNKKINPD